MSSQTSMDTRPTVKVYYQKDMVAEEEFKYLLYGMEEEGIPYEICAVDEENIFILGHNASKDSRLGVGLGVSKGEAILHYEKLDKGSPLFRVNLHNNSGVLRDLGANAARLVKRIPFKKI